MRTSFFRAVAALALVTAICNGAFAQSSGFDTSRMDRSADACDDFFQFASGTWVKNTEIPASQSRWGTFNMLAESNRDVSHDILESAAKTKAPMGSSLQLIGDYYASCMDEAAIEKAGTTPLDGTFKAIDNIKTAPDVLREVAQLHNMGVGAMFRLGGAPDQGRRFRRERHRGRRAPGRRRSSPGGTRAAGRVLLPADGLCRRPPHDAHRP